uniref:DMAP-interaction domain-containing protein n=1 Tax=Elaeophora elaphi TaxID=1147741 RepID=A0A0R3RU70_9BILA
MTESLCGGRRCLWNRQVFVMVDAIDVSSLPSDVRERLAQLDLELSEAVDDVYFTKPYVNHLMYDLLTVVGSIRLICALMVRLLMIRTGTFDNHLSFSGDITQKGYDKKRNLLLGPYLRIKKDGNKTTSSPSTRAQRKHQRRLTRDESRFHSEIHAEAVQQALAEYSEGKKEKPNILPPVKRRGTETKRERHRASDSSSEDDSMFGSTDRSKGTSSTLSLNEQQKKNLTNGFQKSDASSFAPPPDVTTAVANGAAVRNVFQDRKKKTNDNEWPDSKIIKENEWNAMKKATDVTEAMLNTDVVYANDVAESDIAITNITNQDYQNAVVRKLI